MLAILAVSLADAQVVRRRPPTYWNTSTPAETTSYTNTGGSGDRQAIITETASSSCFAAGSVSDLIDGSQADDAYFSGEAAADHWIKFDFGSGKIIDEAKWYQDLTTSHGTWQWQGSNNNVDWTNIGSTFTLGGVATQTHTTLNGNTTSYRYYLLDGVSGTKSWDPFTREIEFKIKAGS